MQLVSYLTNCSYIGYYLICISDLLIITRAEKSNKFVTRVLASHYSTRPRVLALLYYVQHTCTSHTVRVYMYMYIDVLYINTCTSDTASSRYTMCTLVHVAFFYIVLIWSCQCYMAAQHTCTCTCLSHT